MRKILGRLLLTTLGALGLLGCDSTSDLGPQPAEYACPYADFLLKGTVLDADSSKAIEGIEIGFSNVTAYSDANGNWQIAGRPWSCFPRSSLYSVSVDGETNGDGLVKGTFGPLFAVDVDGEANRGAFLPDSLAVSPKLKEPIWPHDPWYRGCFEQTGIVITMEKTP